MLFCSFETTLAQLSGSYKGAAKSPAPLLLEMPGFECFPWKWVRAEAAGVSKTHRCQSSFSPPFPPQACYSWALSNQRIFPLPLLTMHCLKVFMLRIKSPSGLESVGSFTALLFLRAGFRRLFCSSLAGEGSPQPEPAGTIRYGSRELTQGTTKRARFQPGKHSVHVG